jgi:hypothetical protein
MKAALKAKWDKKKAERAEALSKIAKFVAEFGDDELKRLNRVYLEKSTRAPTEHRMNPKLQTVIDLFADVDVVNEDTVYAKYKMGRGDTRIAIVVALKKAKPEDRIWVSFDQTTGNYTVKGRGAAMPEGWRGYIPKA